MLHSTVSATTPHSRWHALYTKPFCEQMVSDALEVRGIEVFMPMVPVWRARRRQVEQEPLFPCYGFAHIDWSEVKLSEVNWTPGLRSIVQIDGVPVTMPEQAIDHLRQRVREMSDPARPRFEKGTRVRVLDGPLKDLEAVFIHSLSGQQRAAILVEVLGRLSRFEVPMAWLS